MVWGFYGRQQELDHLGRILDRKRWFFVKVMGRRRIGKTTLIQRALQSHADRPLFYVQTPDSSPAGVLSAVADAYETFGLDENRHPRPANLLDLAKRFGALARDGFVVAIDEFQYFNRKHLFEFCSLLQAEVDLLSADADAVRGGLIVLGSIHTEMAAILEDRSAPLYNRTTDELELGHLDAAALFEILKGHGDTSPENFLFLWNLFEGVPKFYRDCYEQEALRGDRGSVLRRMFFESSSPLRYEAENWFLKELKGRYDVVLKLVARHPGCSHADLTEHIRRGAHESAEQVGGYLKILRERFGMIERRLPIFAKPQARKGRYYISDNFLRSWLAALSSPMTAVNFRPVDELVDEADRKLQGAEGHGWERLVASLYEERSRKSIGGFSLSHRIQGYWDKQIEIDLVAMDEGSETIRFGTCKRDESKLVADVNGLESNVERFLVHHPQYRDWTRELVACAPTISAPIRASLGARGLISEDLHDLSEGLRGDRS